MKVLFTDEQLTEMESSAHKQVVEDDWVVVEWTYDLIKEVRHYKAKLEEMQKTLNDIREQIPTMQDESESPNMRYNTGVMVMFMIDKVLKGVTQ